MYVHIGWFSKQYNILTDQRYVLHKLTKRWFRIQKKMFFNLITLIYDQSIFCCITKISLHLSISETDTITARLSSTKCRQIVC